MRYPGYRRLFNPCQLSGLRESGADEARSSLLCVSRVHLQYCSESKGNWSPADYKTLTPTNPGRAQSPTFRALAMPPLLGT